MKKYVVCLLLSALSFHSVGFEGCYAYQEEISSFSTGDSELKTSYIKLAKTEAGYTASGLLWGANYHICSIGSPQEGSSAPLMLEKVGDKLAFSYAEPEYDIDCKLEMTLQDGKLNISDSNYQCGRSVFYCGARVGLHDTSLPPAPLSMCDE